MWVYNLFSVILNMSVTAGIIICFVLLCRSLLRKAPKLASYILWSVVLFRLLCPVALPSSLSLLQIWGIAGTGQGRVSYLMTAGGTGRNPFGIPVGQTSARNPDIPSSGTSNHDSSPEIPGFLTPDYFLETEEWTQNGGLHSGEILTGEITNDGIPVDNVPTDGSPTAPTTAASSAFSTTLTSILKAAAWIWLAGCLGMLLYSLVSFLRLKKQLTGAVPLHDNIYQGDYLAAPFVLGLFRPRIYLPSSLSETEQEYILLHEQIHIRRGDPIVKMFAFLALTLHWFNPLVWLAFHLAGKDMEMSCDEAVLRKMGGDIRTAYSRSLLGLATGTERITGAPLSFGNGDVKTRIKNVMRYRKPAVLGSLLAVVLVAAALITLGSNPAAEPDSGSNTDTDIADAAQPGSNAPENSGADAALSADSSPLFFEQYTGYLDEAADRNGVGSYTDADYDGDGKTDRVYREHIEDSFYCHYRIEFGNGDILALGKAFADSGVPSFLAADLTGNGSNEIIFCLNYPQSLYTDAMMPTGFGDFIIFEKTANGYERMAFPLETGVEDVYSLELNLTTELMEEDHSIRVSCEDFPFEAVLEIEDEHWEKSRFDFFHAGRKTYTDGMYDFCIRTKDGRQEFVFWDWLFDKSSPWYLEVVVSYRNGAFVIDSIHSVTETERDNALSYIRKTSGGTGTATDNADSTNGTTGNSGNTDTDSDTRPVPYFPFFSHYTGYLDEAVGRDNYESYLDADYDADGKTDRIYRQHIEETDYCRYRIEFGNGDVLKLDREVYDIVSPAFQAVDLTGDGQNEILFSLHNYTGTDPTGYGNFAIFEKTPNGYERLELPFIDYEKDGYMLLFPYGVQQVGPDTVQVFSEDPSFETIFSVKKWLDMSPENSLNFLWGSTPTVGSGGGIIYDMEIIEDSDTRKLRCRDHIFGKWSSWDIEVTVAYRNGQFVIENVDVIDWETDAPVERVEPGASFPVTDVTMAQGRWTDDNNHIWEMTLKLTDGTCYPIKPDEKSNLFANSYQGSYELLVHNTFNGIKKTFDLNADWAEDAGSHISFPHEFDLFIQDYNEDGQPDFTIGFDHYNSPNRQFILYTAEEDGTIRRLCEEPIPELAGIRYSTLLGVFAPEGADDDRHSFEVNAYDSTIGRMRFFRYDWDEEKGIYYGVD